MNRRDLEELRRRLEARQIERAADHPAMLILAASMFVLTFLILAFI